MNENDWVTPIVADPTSTDFVIGEDSFESLEIRKGSEGSGFYYFFDTRKNRLIKRFVLGESKSGIKTCCTLTFIENNGKYRPRVEFSKRTQAGQIADEAAEDNHVKSRIDLKPYHETFWALIDYVGTLKNVEVPRSGLVAVSKTDKELLDNIKLSREFVQKVLSSFASKEAQDLLIQAKKDDVTNLYASVKQAKNKQAINELKELTKNEVRETELQHWIKENNWVFGIEYVHFLDGSRIGIHSDSDFIVESLDGFADLIELKKASFTLFMHDSSHDSYYPSSELSKVIGQAINYMHVMEEHRHILREQDSVLVLKPRIKIVIGRSSDLNDKQRKALRLLNNRLHEIEIITYDEIITRAQRIIKHYDKD